MRKTLIGLCLLLLPLRADAATLSGFVTDRESGESLLYANVSVRGTSLGALTNPNGYYAVRAIPPGVHVVVFSFGGPELVRLHPVEPQGEQQRVRRTGGGQL